MGSLKQNNTRENDYILLGIGLIFALILFKSLQMEDYILNENFLSVDAHTYIQSSNHLFNEFTAHPIRPLGYAFILGLPNLVLNSVSIDAYMIYSIIINLILWLGIIFILHKSLRLFVGKKSSFIATLLFVFCIGNIFQIFQISTETITTFLLVLMTYFLFKYEKNKNIKHLIWGISVLNISILFRPGMFYFAGLISLILICYLFYIRGFNHLKSIPFLVSVLFVVIQFTAIYKTYGNITPSYIDKLAWYTYLGGKSNAAASNISYSHERKIRREVLKGHSWNEKSRISNKDMKNQLTNNLENVFIEYVKNIIENSNGGSSRIIAIQKIKKTKIHTTISNRLYKISRYQNRLFVLLSFFSIFLMLINRKRVHVSLLISFGSILYIISTSGISFFQGDRFHLIFYPLVILIIFYFISLNTYAQQWLKK